MMVHYYLLKREGKVIAMERRLPGINVGETRLVNLGLSEDAEGFKVVVREVRYLGGHRFRDIEDFTRRNDAVIEELLRGVRHEQA